MNQSDEPFAYLNAEDVIDLHALLFGLLQQVAGRLRSRPALEGAVARPRRHPYYTGADLADQIRRLSADLSAEDFGEWIRNSLVPRVES